MITPSLTAALNHKNASPFPASIRISGGQWQVINKLQTMTEAQRAGLYVAYEWHRAYGRSGDDSLFHPIQFEIYGIQAKGKGPALASALRQLGLLLCHNGRYRLSPAGLNLVKTVNIENQEC
ncbi:hypothetical protein [Rheinheimera salexigens]|uniref:Uncharacterized protein n=1 Tax=Rheinheimera salexigens TaxID=1628148 RepID=A0A1E7Q8H5_9GAMM|nr:hypothetical protein [Rheinheimera salexigens]OEY70363.1 hypothetical protein BI198_12850 [Rheinheimera salexigens]